MSVPGAIIGLNNYQTVSNCPSQDGCPSGICPDFTIKRHDTKPAFKVLVEDCDGPLDLTDQNLVLEANIWCKAKLKKDIGPSDNYFALSDNVGFDQIMTGDIIIFDRIRLPEFMLVLGFDETNKLIEVQRSYRGTISSSWKKGSCMRIFRTMNASASIETVLKDVDSNQTSSCGGVKLSQDAGPLGHRYHNRRRHDDDVVTKDMIEATYLVYNWSPSDTCTPGCYWMEFKLLRMLPLIAPAETITVDVNVQSVIDVLANDSNPDGVSLSIYSVTPPTHGVATISSDNKILYTPNEDYVGEDIFSYILTDGVRKQTAEITLDVIQPLIQMLDYDDAGISEINDVSNISFTPSNLSAIDFGCTLGLGVDWVRRFPLSDGFLIKIEDSPTKEMN